MFNPRRNIAASVCFRSKWLEDKATTQYTVFGRIVATNATPFEQLRSLFELD